MEFCHQLRHTRRNDGCMGVSIQTVSFLTTADIGLHDASAVKNVITLIRKQFAMVCQRGQLYGCSESLPFSHHTTFGSSEPSTSCWLIVFESPGSSAVDSLASQDSVDVFEDFKAILSARDTLW